MPVLVEAARDVFIVQDTQYSCGGVEDCPLTDVLRPTSNWPSGTLHTP